jgi:hypothetical protein
MLDFVLLVVVVCAALGVLAWVLVGGAVFVRNVVAVLMLAWEALTAIPAVLRVVKRRITEDRWL